MKTRWLRISAFVLVTLGALFLFGIRVARAQFNTPSIDCDVLSNEYGTGNANNYFSGTPQWFMTWDDTYLYVSIQNARETEAANIYLDLDPLAVVNGGANSDGNLVGTNYDGTTHNLPIRADAFIYAKNDYREFMRRDSAGGWTSVNAGVNGLGGGSSDYSEGLYCSLDRGNGAGSDDDRELRISWSRLTGGGSRPATFNWFGYITFNNGVYGQVPIANPSGDYGTVTTQNAVRYFTVSSTTNGFSTNPYSQESYTFVGTSDVTNFGAISVYDFTMNSPERSITRATGAGGAWNIGHNFRIEQGTVDFGTSTHAANVSGDVLIGASGILKLSTTSGGDLQVNGNFTNNGTTPTTSFVPNNRAVFFNGTTNITGNNTFDYIVINSAKTVNFGSTSTSITNDVSNAGTLNGQTGTITLSGSGGRTISGSGIYNFNNLTVNLSSGNLNLSNSVAIHIAGNFTRSAGGLSCASSQTNASNTCTLDFNGGGTSTLSNSVLMPWNITIQSGTTVNTSSSFTLRGNIGGAGTFNATGGTITMDTVTVVILSGTVTFNNITIGSPVTLRLASNANMGFRGTFTINSGAAFDATTNSPTTLTIAGTSGQTLPSGATTLRNLTINPSATLSAPSSLNIAGNFSNNGTFTHNSGTVTFNGTSAQTLTGATDFFTLVLDNAAGLTLNNNVTVSQGLALTSGDITTGNNTLAQTITSYSSGNGDVVGNVRRAHTFGVTTYSFGNPNVQMNLTNVVTQPTEIIVNLKKSKPSDFSNAINREYTITASGGNGIAARLRLHYLDTELNGNTEANLQLWRYDTTLSLWTQQVRTSNSDTEDWVEKIGIPDFSRWTLSASAPTNIVLSAFKLKATTKPSVKVKWKTGTESAVVGFNIYRATKLNGTYKLLNVEMIDPKSPGQIAENQYTYTDKRVKRGKTYYYQIEVIQAGVPNELSDIKKIKVP